ncbi:MAG: RnfABCDGE type electron transport complex subunit C [Oscillospiraceae bacterium]|nr:RnfABCDGE type electron transport complex subunit C [Oscillospiraceae bacterium]
MYGKRFHLPHKKNAAEMRTKKLDSPGPVIISMVQNIGAPCVPVVKPGDYVQTGQLIADSDSFVSAPVYSSVTGKVLEERFILGINGNLEKTLVIEPEKNEILCEKIAPPVIETRAQLIEAVRKSGLVGLGGAGFPTHVKIGYDSEKFNVDTLIINGAECEPYITSDYREFMENSGDVIKGIKLIMKLCAIPHAIIGIEKNRPIAVKLMRELLETEKNIKVKPLPTNYPQGAEKVLIYNTTRRIVKEGQLPLSEGCLILNVSSVAFIARYAETGIPLISRRITIDGNIVNKPSNYLVPVGMTLGELMKKTDLRLQPDRIIFGGPMMGKSVYDLDTPVCKTTGAVLFFKDMPEYRATSCIRCGKCLRACSMNLMPTEFEKAYEMRDLKRLRKLRVNLCMECGSCSYICPAKRNLTERNKLAKDLLRKEL